MTGGNLDGDRHGGLTRVIAGEGHGEGRAVVNGIAGHREGARAAVLGNAGVAGGHGQGGLDQVDRTGSGDRAVFSAIGDGNGDGLARRRCGSGGELDRSQCRINAEHVARDGEDTRAGIEASPACRSEAAGGGGVHVAIDCQRGRDRLRVDGDGRVGRKDVRHVPHPEVIHGIGAIETQELRRIEKA